MPVSSTPLSDMTNGAHVMSGYAQFESANESSPGRYVFSSRHEAGGNANTIYIYQSTTTQLASATTDAGAQTAFTNPGPNVAGADWQVAWRAKNDDYAISVAGLAQQTDTTADVMGVALDRLYIGNRAGGAQGNRTIQKIVFVPSAWSNATLETKVGN